MRARRGESLLDHLLVLTVAAVAVVAAAYAWMPEFRRALATVSREAAAALGVAPSGG